MQRTQLRLPTKIKNQLQFEAKRKGVSMGELTRNILRKSLKNVDHKKTEGLASLKRLAKHSKQGKKVKMNSNNFRQYYSKILGYER